MTIDPDLAALIHQAARNIETLAALVHDRDQETADLEILRRRIQRLKNAYTRETDAVTQAVLRDALERRHGGDRRREGDPASPE